MEAVMVAAQQKKEKIMKHIFGYTLSNKNETELFNLFNEILEQMNGMKADSIERNTAVSSLENITRAIASRLRVSSSWRGAIGGVCRRRAQQKAPAW